MEGVIWMLEEKSKYNISTIAEIVSCKIKCQYQQDNDKQNQIKNKKDIRQKICYRIGKFSKKRIQEIEDFMNNYPRKMFDGLSSNEVYRIAYEKL